MSTQLWRILGILTAFAVVLGVVLGGGPMMRWAQSLSESYGGGFVVLAGLMTLLVLISIVRMPLSHANARRRHR